MKTLLNTSLPVYYQSTIRNKNNPFQVTILKINGKKAEVRSQGETPIEFKCNLSSLYN